MNSVHDSRDEQDEHQRSRQPELPAHQLREVAPGPRRVPVAGAPALLGEAGPAMRPVPGQHRGEQRQRQQNRQPRPGGAQPAPPLDRRQQPPGQAHPDQGGRILAVERQAEGCARQQPPGAAPGRQHPPESRQRGGPEEQQRRVRGHGDAADAEQQGGVQQHRRHQRTTGPVLPVAQVGGGRGQKQGAKGSGHRRQQTHAERAVAAQQRSRPDPQRHHGRMVEIARRQGARPHPVVRLVGGQWREAAHREPEHGQQQQGCEPRPQRSRQIRVADTA